MIEFEKYMLRKLLRKLVEDGPEYDFKSFKRKVTTFRLDTKDARKLLKYLNQSGVVKIKGKRKIVIKRIKLSFI